MWNQTRRSVDLEYLFVHFSSSHPFPFPASIFGAAWCGSRQVVLMDAWRARTAAARTATARTAAARCPAAHCPHRCCPSVCTAAARCLHCCCPAAHTVAARAATARCPSAQPCWSPPAAWPGTGLLGLPRSALNSCLLQNKVGKKKSNPQTPQNNPAWCGAVAYVEAEEIMGAEGCADWVAVNMAK